MTKTGFVYDDIYLEHKAPFGHPECGERLIQIVGDLKKSPLWDSLIHIKPRRAEFEEIGLVHSSRYIEKITAFGSGNLDPDTYVSEKSLEAARYAAGGVIEAVERCKSGEINRAFCAVRPPGHHAEAGRGMGFCLFNNVAIGARYAQKSGYSKVFIIDFDVHHGNGTQHIFEEDDTVFYFSTHQFPHYPGTGAESETGRGKGKGFTYNAPMRSGSGDAEYFAVYQDILPGLIHKFAPDIIFVSGGYDLHRNDPLSGIRVTTEGIGTIVHSILTSSNCPVIFALEGGYDLDALSEGVRITIAEMLRN